MSEGQIEGAGAGAPEQSAMAEGDAGGEAPAQVAEMLDLEAFGGRNVKVTVDGEEMSLPLSEVLGGYQRAKASSKRFEEASQLRKKAEMSSKDAQTILDAMGGNDPERFERLLRAAGADQHLERLLENRLRERLQYEAMTDRERERYDFDQERKAFEQERGRAEEQRANVATEQAQKAIMKGFSQTLTEKGISPGGDDYPWYVQHMAQVALEAHRAGVRIDPAECFELVEKERGARDMRRIRGLESDSLIELLGEDVLGKLRKADLARLKRSAKAEAPKSSRRARSKPKKKTMTPDEFREMIASRRGRF